jgi:transposase
MDDMAGRRIRTREPQRAQGRFLFEVPADALPPDHRARVLWRVVETLDLRRFVNDARAVEGVQGRDVVSVRMLLALWLYAISEGIGSAREIERRIQSDAAFRWIVGDVPVGRTKLAVFRVANRDALDRLLSDVLASLMHKGFLSLGLVAQDGTRVRASASAPSFRRVESLEACREQARLHVKAVLAAGDDPEVSEQVKRAREAAARDYERRIEEAIATVQELSEERAESRKKTRNAPRASTTDADARVMKMADGGFRPAYNVQLATTGSPLGGARTIVGVRVTNLGSDMGSVAPMLDDVERRTGRLPDVLLADANHGDHASIRDADARGVAALISVPKPRGGATAGERAENDRPIAAWRARMETDEAKQTYRARASLCELPNAHFKSRLGLGSLLVRGLDKVTCVVLLTALASNLLAHASALLAT